MDRLNRRNFLYGSATVAGAALVGSPRVMAQTASAPTESDVPRVSLPDPTARQGEFVEVNGVRIFVQSSGDGAPMLLLHGYPLSGALFSRVREGLAAGHRVITVDHRGYGMSEAPGVPDSIQVYAKDALAVMQQMGIEQATVGGMSMGGPIAFEMYKQAPERFSGLVLIDTIAAPANPAETGLWNGVRQMVEQNGVPAILPVLIKEMLSGDTRLEQPELVSYLETVMKAASKEAAMGGATALAERPDYTDLLSQIDVPTLVYVGLADSVYPIEIAQMMQQKISGSTLEVIDRAAHAAIFEAPDRSVEAISGWASGPATAEQQ